MGICNPYAALFALIAAIILSVCARKPGNNPPGKNLLPGKISPLFYLTGEVEKVTMSL
jgi:hypothetical protein